MWVWRASPAIVKFHTESVCLAWQCTRRVHVCVAREHQSRMQIHMSIFIMSPLFSLCSLIGCIRAPPHPLFLFLIRSLCPQVRVWLLIPWAAALLNLQHMIHNRSPVKLNHSLFCPLINIQWRTKSLHWSTSSQLYPAFSSLQKIWVWFVTLIQTKHVLSGNKNTSPASNLEAFVYACVL